MSKKKRIDEILSLIEQYEIDTQEELTGKLIERGYVVSQATVSRDINELSLIKINGTIKKFKYSKPLTISTEIPERIINLFKQVLLTITIVNNLIVVKTPSGTANTGAMAIDEMRINNLLGTIAGDDTILLIAKSDKDAENIYKTLKAL